MTKKQYFRLVSSLLIVPFVVTFLLVSQADAAQATQDFKVKVNPKLTIAPPAAEASIIHDGNDTDQAFAPQLWDVKANARSGATVIFATDQAFTSVGAETYKADASLGLAISSAQSKAGWSVTNPADVTNYTGSDEVATVQAASTKAGKATFALTVTFINDPEGVEVIAEGDYILTVTGTLTAN